VICAVCDDAIKTSILTNKPLTKAMIEESLKQRVKGFDVKAG